MGGVNGWVVLMGDVVGEMWCDVGDIGGTRTLLVFLIMG